MPRYDILTLVLVRRKRLGASQKNFFFKKRKKVLTKTRSCDRIASALARARAKTKGTLKTKQCNI